MINIYDISWQGGFAMPVHRTADAVRALTVVGVLDAGSSAAKRRFVDVAPVCGHTATTDGFVLAGAFPGTSSWSPPI